MIGDGADDALLGGAGDDALHIDVHDLGEGTGAPVFTDPVADAIRDAYEGADSDDTDIEAAFRGQIDGGSGRDRLYVRSDGDELFTLTGDKFSDVSNIEVLDLTGLSGGADLALSVDDLVSMTDEENALTILLGEGDNTVKIDGAELDVEESPVEIPVGDDIVTVKIEQPAPAPEAMI